MFITKFDDCEIIVILCLYLYTEKRDDHIFMDVEKWKQDNIYQERSHGDLPCIHVSGASVAKHKWCEEIRIYVVHYDMI